MRSIRNKIKNTLYPSLGGGRISRIYNYIMLAAIIVGLLPLMFLHQTKLLITLDIISCSIFIIDYLLRWITADFQLKYRRRWISFVLYPFSFMAIIDLLSILPTISMLSPVLKTFRVSRLFKILRIFKFIRYYEPLELIFSVINKQRTILLMVFSLALFYTFVTALIMFNAGNGINEITGQPLFPNFYVAFYWAASTLTTVGYGDIYPINDLGRAISMLSAFVGVAIVALPSGIITAAYMEELKLRKNKSQIKN
jgi:ion transporter